MIVLVVPVGDDDLGVEHGVEAVDVQALVALAGVERLDVAVVPRGSRRDERQADPIFRPGGDRVADELRTVVAAQHQWIPAGDRYLVDQGDDTLTGDRGSGQAAEGLTGVLIDDGAHLQRLPVLDTVELKVDAPHVVGCGRRDVLTGGGGADALAPAALRDPQALLPPQPLRLLVIDDPALSARIMVGSAVAPPRMLLRIRTQPRAQPGVAVDGGLVRMRDRERRAGQAHHPAREPRRDAQHVDQVAGSSPLRARAHHFPRDSSRSAAFSSSASARSRFNVAFSFSRSFNRFASSAFIPPYWLRQRWNEDSEISNARHTPATSSPLASIASA